MQNRVWTGKVEKTKVRALQRALFVFRRRSNTVVRAFTSDITLPKFFVRRHTYSFYRRARLLVSKTTSEKPEVSVVIPYAEPMRLTGNPIINKDYEVVGILSLKAGGHLAIVRRDEQLPRANRYREVGIGLVHSVRHYNWTVSCKKRKGLMKGDSES
jgi:hypothetical protein